MSLLYCTLLYCTLLYCISLQYTLLHHQLSSEVNEPHFALDKAIPCNAYVDVYVLEHGSHIARGIFASTHTCGSAPIGGEFQRVSERDRQRDRERERDAGEREREKDRERQSQELHANVG